MLSNPKCFGNLVRMNSLQRRTFWQTTKSFGVLNKDKRMNRVLSWESVTQQKRSSVRQSRTPLTAKTEVGQRRTSVLKDLSWGTQKHWPNGHKVSTPHGLQKSSGKLEIGQCCWRTRCLIKQTIQPETSFLKLRLNSALSGSTFSASTKKEEDFSTLLPSSSQVCIKHISILVTLQTPRCLHME